MANAPFIPFLISLQLPFKELRNLSEQVVACVATIDAVVAVGVNQFPEVLVGLHECLAVLKGVLRVHVVVGQTMAYEE